MKKHISNFSTLVSMSPEEAKNVCRLGQGEATCAFLVIGKGFECYRMAYPANASIFRRLEDGSMVAKGKGGWVGCEWEKELADSITRGGV